MNKYIKILILFLFSISIRSIDLTIPAITFDEPTNLVQGYRIIKSLTDPDIKVWDDSVLYNYDAPPLARYLYGIIAYRHIDSNWIQRLSILRTTTIIMGSLTVVLIYLITKELYSEKEAIVAAFIFSTLPMSIAHTKMAVLEAPLIFMFALTMYVFIKLKGNTWRYPISVLLAGLTFSTKYLGLSSLGIIAFSYAILGRKNNNLQLVLIRLFRFGIKYAWIFLLIFIITFPFLWQDTLNRLGITLGFHSQRGERSLLPMFQAFLMNLIYMLVSTPAIIVILFIIGLLACVKNPTEENKFVLLWLLAPFVLVLFLSLQDHMRYVFTALIPLSIIASIGLNKIVDKKSFRNFAYISLFVYMMTNIYYIHPFYLDYYNEFVGGTGTVYKYELFDIAYLGEGLGLTMEYLRENLPDNEMITMQFFIEPNPMNYAWGNKLVVPLPPEDIPTANYVVINTNCVQKNCDLGWLYDFVGAPSPGIKYDMSYEKVEDAGYEKIYEANIRGAVLSRVYRRIE